MEAFNREKEEMAQRMKQLQDIIDSKDHEMQHNEKVNQ